MMCLLVISALRRAMDAATKSSHKCLYCEDGFESKNKLLVRHKGGRCLCSSRFVGLSYDEKWFSKAFYGRLCAVLTVWTTKVVHTSSQLPVLDPSCCRRSGDHQEAGREFVDSLQSSTCATQSMGIFLLDVSHGTDVVMHCNIWQTCNHKGPRGCSESWWVCSKHNIVFSNVKLSVPTLLLHV